MLATARSARRRPARQAPGKRSGLLGVIIPDAPPLNWRLVCTNTSLECTIAQSDDICSALYPRLPRLCRSCAPLMLLSISVLLSPVL